MPALNSIRRTFDRNLESAELLFEVASKFAVYDEGTDPDPPLRPGQAKRIAGLAFMVTSKVWEELVEVCLVRYLMGTQAPSGTAFEMTQTPPARRLDSAYRLATGPVGLTGSPDGWHCSDWTRVQSCARTFLVDGTPFTALSDQQRNLLARATTIRNRVAHDSTKCRTAFLKVAAQQGGRDGVRPSGYSVGHLLLKRTSTGFGGGVKSDLVFRHYARNFRAMADVIVPVPDGWNRDRTTD